MPNNIRLCYVCNETVRDEDSSNLIKNKNSLPSGKQLFEILNQILDSQVDAESLYSYVVCKKCYKCCAEYDVMMARLIEIKSDLLSQYKISSKSRNARSLKEVPPDPLAIIKTEPSEIQNNKLKKIVLSASKLKPLPPNYVIINKRNLPVSAGANLRTKICSTKQAIVSSATGNSILKQSLKSSGILSTITSPIKQTTSKQLPSLPMINMSLPTLTIDNSMLTSTCTSIINSGSVTTWDAKSSKYDLKVNQTFPKDFLTSPNKSESVTDDSNEARVDLADEELVEMENSKEQPMEIDDECTFVSLQDHSQVKDDLSILEEAHEEEANKNQVEKNKQSLFELALMRFDESTNSKEDKHPKSIVAKQDGGSKKFIFGNVEIIADENDIVGDESAIVMEENENGSVIRMVSGQKLIYNDNEISLIIPEQESEADTDHRDEEDDGRARKDSNDESQIELQMSGDEETANAIIKAAKNQGGAFIKVESGEMYRVETVKTESNCPIIMDTTQFIVAKDGARYKCLLCDNASSARGEAAPFSSGALDMMRHTRQAHSARVYICSCCGEIMRRRSEYTAHTIRHREDAADGSEGSVTMNKRFICSICLKNFCTRKLLEEHTQTHSGTKPYKCQKCSKTFVSKYTHQAHMKTHQNRPRPFKCALCTKTFFTQQNLSQHEKTHSGVKDFICKICGKAFGTQHNLEVHGVVHSGNKPFLCGTCGKKFARKAEIKDHIRTHTGERPFTCDICSTSFSQRSNLLSHRRATHFDDKRYHCDHCEKRFKRKRLLDYHIKATHTGERPYMCEVCQATFVYPEHYKKHKRIHSGYKPFPCEYCGKGFNSRDNRNSHRFVHSDKKQYECVVCGAGFMRKPLLYVHMNNASHYSEFIIMNQPVIRTEVTPESEVIHTITMESVKVKDNKDGEEQIYIEGELLESIEETELVSSENNITVTEAELTDKDSASMTAVLTSNRRYILHDENQVYEVTFDGSNDARHLFDTDELTGKTTLNVVSDDTDSKLITIADLRDDVMSESGKSKPTMTLSDVHANKLGILGSDAHIMSSEDNGLVRLVHMQLGDSGWVTIDQ